MTSDLVNEMNKLSSIKDMKSMAALSNKSLKSVTNVLSQSGLISESTTQAIGTASSALSSITSMLGLVKAARMAQARYNDVQKVRSAALIAVNIATGPVGWGKIALATAMAAGTSVAIYGIVNTINVGSFNLSTSSGQSQAVAAVGGTINA